MRSIPHEDRFNHWLGKTVRGMREEAGLVRSQIAGPLAISTDSVKRFEDGESIPHQLDDMLEVYVQLLGLDHRRDLIRMALEGWATHDGRKASTD